MTVAIAAALFLSVVFAEFAHLGSVAVDLVSPPPVRYVPASMEKTPTHRG